MRIREKTFFSEDWRKISNSLGLKDFESFLAFDQGDLISEVRDRIVYRYRGWEGIPDFYLKIYRHPGANHPLAQLLRFQRPKTLAEREAENLLWLENQGILAPKVLAWGGRVLGFSEVNSFLVTEAMEGFVPLNEFLERNCQSLPPHEYRKSKLDLLHACATLLADLHRRGFHHPFPYLRHFFVPEQPHPLTPTARGAEAENEISPLNGVRRGREGEVLQVGIIDVDFAKISNTVSRRDRARGLAELLLSSFKSPLSQTDRLRFFQVYCGGRPDQELLTLTFKRFYQKLRRHPNRYAWVREALSRIPFPASLKDSISD